MLGRGDWRLCLLVLFALALAVRCYAVAFHAAEPVADAADYQRLAGGLANGLGYVDAAGAPTAWRPPGYPFFLAGLYSIFGVSVTAAAYAQAALGALSVLLLAVLCALVAGRREGLVAGFLAAVYPGFFWVPRLLLSENLSLSLTLASLCAALMLVRTRGLKWALALGLLSGAGALVRGANLAVAGLLIVWILFCEWRRRPRAEWGRLAAALLLCGTGLLLLMLPWTARNYTVFRRFVPIATQDGLTFYASYWPPERNGRLTWGALPGGEDPAVAEAARAGDEVAVSKQLQAVALGRLREHPGRFFSVIPSKLISLAAPFDWELFPHAAGQTRSLNPVYVLVLIPAMLGVLVLRRRRAEWRGLLWVVPAAVLVQAVIFYGSPRFRLPAETSALMWAAAALVWLWDWKVAAALGSLVSGRRKQARGV